MGVSGGEIEQVRRSVVEKLRRPAERGIQQSPITQSFQSTEASEQFELNRENDFPIQPNWLIHFANSLKAFE